MICLSGVFGHGGGNLSYLVPSYDPSKGDLLEYSQKVELVAAAWPEHRIGELVAFPGMSRRAKPQQRQNELMGAGKPGIQKGCGVARWLLGTIPLERKYETADKALFRCVQKQDESNDSYLARADIKWSKLLAKKTSLEVTQSYVVLKGSSLTADDKRVVLEADASKRALDMQKVSCSIRLLGAGFFQEVTASKRVWKQKVCDRVAFVAENRCEPEGCETHHAWGTAMEESEEDLKDALVAEGDEDAIFMLMQGDVFQRKASSSDPSKGKKGAAKGKANKGRGKPRASNARPAATENPESAS